LFRRILLYLNSGDARSSKTKKNIIASFVIRILNIIIGIVFVPLLINYLDPAKYGVWITMSSMIAWFGFFNIGLGNGLRNRLAEAFAIKDYALAKSYISTTFAILSLIFGALILIFALINPLLSWSSLLNTGELIPESELSNLALIIFFFFALRFVFQVITSLLMADQRPAFASAFDLVSKILILIAIMLLRYYSVQSLQVFGSVSAGFPVLVLIVMTIWLFGNKYKHIRPSFASIDFKKANGLLSLGFRFFFIQISGMLLYQTNNIIISHLFGPELVTPYNIAYKYFSVLLMLFTIVLTPFWSAFTEAWAKNDIAWIRKKMNRLKKLWFLLLGTSIIMLILSSWIYKIWIGSDVIVPFGMSALVCGWILIKSWNGLYSHLFNGIGKIKIQMLLALVLALLNIPLAILLGKYLGIMGVLAANIIVSLPSVVIYPIQAKKIFDGTASGIWNK